VLIASEGSILGQGVTLVPSSVSLSHLHVISAVKLCCIKTSTKIVIFYIKSIQFMILYVCTCAFLLHQESFDMILVDNPPYYDGGVAVGMSNVEVKCMLTNLKNDQPYFYSKERVLPT
jgi:hypothetical protein